MTPSNVYCPLSRYHFERVVTMQSSFDDGTGDDDDDEAQTMVLYHKASFWLATFHDDDDDDDDDNRSFLPPPKITKCPQDYVISLYSTFAERFDDFLVRKLHYRTPRLLRRSVDDVLRRQRRSSSRRRQATFPRGVDLGCGTGLSGLAFRDLVRHFAGVDLSPEMMAKAVKRGVYDETGVCDVEGYLKRCCLRGSGTWDVVISCDVFVYLGDLGCVFREVRRVLTREKGGGLFSFSTEWMDETTTTNMMTENGSATTTTTSDDDDGYALGACARFAHKESYVKRVARECGFVVLAWDVTAIRRNNGKDVTGILAVLGLK